MPQPVEPAGGAGGLDGQRERVVVEVNGKRLEVVLPAALAGSSAGAARAAAPGRAERPRPSRGGRGRGQGSASDSDVLVSPMQGTIVKIVAIDGKRVSAGDVIVVLESRLMEQTVTAL